jgi:hypothetical protein
MVFTEFIANWHFDIFKNNVLDFKSERTASTSARCWFNVSEYINISST